MFIERAEGAITDEEWRHAIEAAGGRLFDGGLEVALRDGNGLDHHPLASRGELPCSHRPR